MIVVGHECLFHLIIPVNEIFLHIIHFIYFINFSYIPIIFQELPFDYRESL